MLTRLLLQHTANATGCSHLLLGTSLTSLAISLISQVAQGGGFAIADERQEEWVPPPSPEDYGHESEGRHSPQHSHKQKKQRTVRVIRPLRDVGMKECAAWAWWRCLTVVGQHRPEFSNRQSIGGLTKGTHSWSPICRRGSWPVKISSLALRRTILRPCPPSCVLVPNLLPRENPLATAYSAEGKMSLE